MEQYRIIANFYRTSKPLPARPYNKRSFSMALGTFIGLLFSLQAGDLQMSPDGNTYWRQPNNTIAMGEKMSPTQWMAKGPIVVSAEGDGLRITSAETPEQKGAGILERYIPVSEEYPYLQFTISKINPGTKPYKAFVLGLGGNNYSIIYRMISQMEEGEFSVKVYTANRKPSEKLVYFRMDICNMEFLLSNLQMIGKPERRIEVTPVDAEKKSLSIGDSYKVTVYLDEPAEDVSVEMINGYLMTQQKIGHGSHGLQLKPEDKDGKLWSATANLEIISGKPLSEDGAFAVGQILFKATVLGSSLKVPLWTWNEIPFAAN